MGCVVESLKEFKNLEKLYGKDLARSFVINYSISVKKISPDQDYYYPTRQEIKDWLTNKNYSASAIVTRALSINPFLSKEAIKSLLSGVIHTLDNKLYITRGTTNYGSVVETAAARNLIFEPNLALMKNLEERFPNIFKIKDSETNEFTKEVEISSITDRETADLIQERATDISAFIENYPSARKTLESERALQIGVRLGEKLQKALGVPYETVNETEAREILEDSATPYSGEAAFFYNNTVYFVTDYLTPDIVLHEYAHPLIKAIAINNPKLFNNLYEQLKTSATGIEIINKVRSEYPDLNKPENQDRFKEEALVTALEKAATAKVDEMASTESGFRKLITNLIYAIKQVLKSLVRKVDLKTLNENTTLDQLANMMVSEDFVIDKIVFDEADFAEFKKDYESVIKAFEKVKPDKIQDAINEFYSTASYLANELRKAPYRLKKELTGKDGIKIFNYIKDNLKEYQSIDVDISKVEPENVIQASMDMHEQFRQQALNLANSIDEVEKFTENAEKVLADMSDIKNYMTADTIARIMYFEEVLNQNKKLINSIRKTIGLGKNNEFVQKLNGIINTIDNALDTSKDLKYKFVLEIYNDESTGMKEAVEQKFRDKINQYFKTVNISQQDTDEFIDQIINDPNGTEFAINDLDIKVPDRIRSYVVAAVKDYYMKRLGKKEFEDFLSGRRGDMGLLGSMFVPYMNMNDPVIGTFARFVNNHLANFQREALEVRDKFLDNIYPDLKAVGYTGDNVGKTAKKLFFVDKSGYRDSKTGEYKQYDKWVLLNKFQDWEFERGKLKDNIEVALEKKNKDEIRQAYTALEEFDEKYMNRKYKKEVYDLRKMWYKDNEVTDPVTKEKIVVDAETSFEAYAERRIKLQNMNTISAMDLDEFEDVHAISQADAARLEYERLYEIKNPDGTMKTGKELQKVLVRKKYRAESARFYETTTDEERVQNDLNNFVLKLAAVGITPEDKPELFAEEMKKFERVNFRIAYTPEYYNTKRDTLKQIREILDKPGKKKTKVAEDLADLYNERFQLVNQITDRNGQANGLQLSEETLKRINSIENKIADLEETFDRYTGLTKEQLSTLNAYEQKINKGGTLTEEEEAEYDELFNTKNEMGLGALEAQELKRLFKVLADLNIKQPTEYYLEAINYALRGLEVGEVTYDNADEWINSPKVIEAMTKSEDFKNWFRLNHYEKEVYDSVLKTRVKKIFRTAAWTVSKPISKDDYKTTTLINPITGEPLIIEGVPSAKYSKRIVRDEFRTGYNPATKKVELIVGKHITNKGKNDFLPKEYNPGDVDSAFDDKFMNKRYAELERSNSPEFKLIKSLTEQVLKLQELGTYGSKIYLDMPRKYHRTNLELAQAGKIKEKFDTAKSTVNRLISRNFTREQLEDAAEQGFNFNVEQSLVSTNLNGEAITQIPIEGLYKLRLEDVSLDFLRGYGDYMQSLLEQRALTEIEPVQKAIRDVLADPENSIKDLKRASRQVKKSTGQTAFLKAAGDNRRLQAYDYFIDKTFYGKRNSTFQEENILTTKLANKLMHVASRSIIGFDLVSAAKQRFGQKFQNMIEAAAGEDVTYKSLATGKGKALKCTFELMSGQIYKIGPKSLSVQMMENFDPVTGKSKHDFSKSSSRTFLKDMLDGSWMYDVRRLAELEGNLALFWGMLDNKFIDQIQPDGKVKKIMYSEAFELDNEGLIKLKAGINPEYSMKTITHEYSDGETLEEIAKKYYLSVEELKAKNKIDSVSDLEPGSVLKIGTSKLFNDFRLRAQGRGFKLNGLIDEFSSPQASKYLGYRLFSFYKNFATGFILNRFQMDTSRENFGGDVYDWNLNTTTKGYYISAAQSIFKLIKSVGRDWPLLTTEEKKALARTTAEGAMIALTAIAIAFLFGYDKDDEDRFEKLRQREEEYGIAGIFANHLLYQTMAVKSENEAFFPVLGFDDMMSMVQNTSIAFGTVRNMMRISADLWHIMTGDDAALYKSDVGPYFWQEEGDYKLWNHLAAIYGVKGKNYDPIYAIKSKETAENLGF